MSDIENNSQMLGGKGVEAWTTRFKLKRRHLSVSIACGLVAAAIPPLMLLGVLSPTSKSLIQNDWSNPSKPIEWSVSCRYDDFVNEKIKCGDKFESTNYVETTIQERGKTLLTKQQYEQFIDSHISPVLYQFLLPSPVSVFNFLIEFLSIPLWLAGFICGYKFFENVGREETSNKRIGGAFDLVSSKNLDKIVRAKGGGDWTLGGVALPKGVMKTGISINGAQRTGKSLLLHDLILQSKRKGVRLFIHDPHREFFQAHYNPHNGDIFLDPTRVGSVPWSFFGDFRKTFEIDTLATAMFPSKGSGDEFFVNAARTVFSYLTLKLARLNVAYISEVGHAFFESDAEQLEHMMDKTPGKPAIDKDAKGQRVGVIATAGLQISGLMDIAKGSYSLNQWLDQKSGNIYIMGSEKRYAGLKRLFVTQLIEMIAARGIIRHDAHYIGLLDELPMFGDIDLDKHLAEKAKFGVAFVTGTQAESQMVTGLGKDRAATLKNLNATHFQLQINSPQDMKNAEEMFGRQKLMVVGQSQTLAIAESRDSLGINKSEKFEPLIQAEKFGQLEPLNGYLKLGKKFPSAKVCYERWLEEGSATDGVGTYANELNGGNFEMPPYDDRFNIVKSGTGDWRRDVKVEMMTIKVNNLEMELKNSLDDELCKELSEQIKRIRSEMTRLNLEAKIESAQNTLESEKATPEEQDQAREVLETTNRELALKSEDSEIVRLACANTIALDLDQINLDDAEIDFS